MLKNFEKIYANVLTGKENLNNKEVQVHCPFHNDKNPSMSINTENGKYICFSCNAHGSAVGYWMQTQGVDYKTALKQLDMFDNDYKTKPTPPKFVTTHPEQLVPKAKKPHVEVDYSDYCYNVWSSTIASETEYEKYGKRLYELRGITYDTAVACMIGYDNSKGWIFPIVRFGDNKTVGYEVRQKEFKMFSNGSKCFKAENTPSCLSVVWQGIDNKKAICCEGLIDSCFMYQYLHEKAQITENSDIAQVKETILTPSNGVKTVFELVNENQLWNKFDEILFVLDNDKASQPVTKELEILTDEHNRKLKVFTGLKEGQDWEDYYKEHRNELLKIPT